MKDQYLILLWVIMIINIIYSYLHIIKKNFMKIGEKPFSHKIINGYHFINWGHCDLSMETSNNNYLWVEREIKKAIKSDDKKPIFVTTHVNAKGTI